MHDIGSFVSLFCHSDVLQKCKSIHGDIYVIKQLDLLSLTVDLSLGTSVLRMAQSSYNALSFCEVK